MSTLYRTVVDVQGGREGRVKSQDGLLELALVPPKELGGKGNGTNPEQLFAAGYGACFESALRLVARQQKKSVEGLGITAHVALLKSDEGKFTLAVELHGHLPGHAREDAQKLMEQAHEVCPYSNATRGNIDVKLFVD